MPAGTDNARSGASHGRDRERTERPGQEFTAPTATNAQSGTAATGGSTSTAAGTDNAQSGAAATEQRDERHVYAVGFDRTSPAKHMKSGAAAKHEQSASDNMAEELNRQELQRVQNGGGQMSGSSQSQAPGAGTSPSRAARQRHRYE